MLNVLESKKKEIKIQEISFDKLLELTSPDNIFFLNALVKNSGINILSNYGVETEIKQTSAVSSERKYFLFSNENYYNRNNHLFHYDFNNNFNDKSRIKIITSTTFYKVRMSNEDLDTWIQKKRQTIKNKRSNRTSKISIHSNIIDPHHHIDILSLDEIMFLDKKFGAKLRFNTIPSFCMNEFKNFFIRVDEIKQLIVNVKKHQDYVKNNHLEGVKLIRYIFDFYKLNAFYWDPTVYGFSYGNNFNNIITDANQSDLTAPHNFNYYGLIKDLYATCSGMADGLVQLLNFFNIRANIISDNNHALVFLPLYDGSQMYGTFIDLACELGLSDGKYERYGGTYIKRIKPRTISDCNKYDCFMKKNCILSYDVINQIPVPLIDVDPFSLDINHTTGRKLL